MRGWTKDVAGEAFRFSERGGRVEQGRRVQKGEGAGCPDREEKEGRQQNDVPVLHRNVGVPVP